MLNVLIFSKDRALQLHSLLASLKDHCRGTSFHSTVLYRASTPDFDRGYSLLRERAILSDITWFQETDFRKNLLSILGTFDPFSALMILVDDDVIFRPVDLEPLLAAFSPRHLFISLRADRSYPGQRQPRFKELASGISWQWHDFRQATVWQYPFSVDGNIFHTEDIRHLVSSVNFKAPNTLEGAMHRRRHNLRFMLGRAKALAPTIASLYNNPLNKVQSEGETWNAGTDPAELNACYLGNSIIDNSALYIVTPTGVHFAVPLSLKTLF